MKKPYSWYDTNKKGMQLFKVGCIVPDIPPTDEPPIWTTAKGRRFCQEGWFTNNTRIPGKPTIPKYMLGGRKPKGNPWSAPGTASIASPCGTFGGNPQGCRGGPPTEKYGDCCGGGKKCGGFAFGHNAETRPPKDAPVTLWELGSIQEVVWQMDANHEGGYSYRLCKIPDDYTPGESLEGILTEDCFRNTTLDFVGDKLKKVRGKNLGGEVKEVPALRTRQGTFPPGSQWTRNPFRKGSYGWVFDNIQIPADLEPGRYVLSFRWDCQF